MNVKKMIIQFFSRQPFVFIIGLGRKSIIRSSFFDVRVLFKSFNIKTEVGSKIFYPSNIGEYSFVGVNTVITPGVDVGRYASIGNNCTLGSGEHDVKAYVLNTKLNNYGVGHSPIFKRTIIKEDVWIGNGVLIKGGIIIGRSTAIGMGSVVLKDIDSYKVAFGWPAKEIRNRFDVKIQKELDISEWWKFDTNIAAKIIKNITVVKPDNGGVR